MQMSWSSPGTLPEAFWETSIFGSRTGAKFLVWFKFKPNYETQLFKMKIVTVGKGAVRLWNKAGLAREMPETWQSIYLQARVVLKNF